MSRELQLVWLACLSKDNFLTTAYYSQQDIHCDRQLGKKIYIVEIELGDNFAVLC